MMIKMVRVNLVSPLKLTDQHLLAEYVELKMLSKFISKYPNGNITEKYSLSGGHLNFFKDKSKFLRERYEKIYNELKNRKFNLDEKNYKETLNFLKSLPFEQQKNYEPTEEAIEINKERILSRVYKPLKRKKLYTYYGESIEPINYEVILK